jgi:DNA-binding transcriptional MerR regulator
MSREQECALKEELTIGEVARLSGLSRSTLLYYHRLGILRPVNRSGGNYRLYSSADVERLKQVCLYRKMGVPLRDIRPLVEKRCDEAPAEIILRKRLATLEEEIELCQSQQQQILRLLEQLSRHDALEPRDRSGLPRKVVAEGRKPRFQSKENRMVNKTRWVEIMAAAGFTEQDMMKWHQTFERMEPQSHQEFLESLGIAPDEIQKIRRAAK